MTRHISVIPAKAGIAGGSSVALSPEASKGLSMPRMLKARPGDGPTLRSFAGATMCFEAAA
jgi:hypothetical protein